MTAKENGDIDYFSDPDGAFYYAATVDAELERLNKAIEVRSLQIEVLNTKADNLQKKIDHNTDVISFFETKSDVLGEVAKKYINLKPE